MSKLRLDWHGDHCRRVIVAELQRRIWTCLGVVLNHARHLLNVAGTMKEKDVEERAAADPEFRKRFNRNRATASVKGQLHSARLKRGRVRYKKLKSED